MDDQPTNRRGADAVRNRDQRSPAADDLFAGTEPPPSPPLAPLEKRDRDDWEGAIHAALRERSPRSLLFAAVPERLPERSGPAERHTQSHRRHCYSGFRYANDDRVLPNAIQTPPNLQKLTRNRHH
jgi:hypothetical protein